MTPWTLQTPVILLIFNRPDTTERVFEAIRQAQPTQLLIIADGPRPDHPQDAHQCAAAREIINHVDWDCDLLKHYSQENLGCRRRVSSGLTWAFQQVEEAIILEDDCLPHPSFFRFCQELLEKYRDEPRIMSISGNNFQFGQRRTPYSYYFSRYNHIWGWATWRRAWQQYDLSMKAWPKLRSSDWLQNKLQHPQVAQYWSRIFDMAYQGFDTWDYAWLFACWYHEGLIALPEVNLVSNIGFNDQATHTKTKSRLADIPVQAAEFPLSHPETLQQNLEADAFTEKYIFSGADMATKETTSSIQLEQELQKIYQALNLLNQRQVIQSHQIQHSLAKLQESIGRLEARQVDYFYDAQHKNTIQDYEFQVFSQWGEDGIIQYLVKNLNITNKKFVEFGVENYKESNTRFLLLHGNWSGLVMDGSAERISQIYADPICWQHDLKALHAFVTRENINHLLSSQNVTGNIGLLSIDVDGNDYWIWNSINVVDPDIVVIEYNSRFGSEKAVTVPYNPEFMRTKAHHSNIYFGASLKALWLLGQEKGYALVGSNRAGNNAFFVKETLRPSWMKSLTVEEGYVASKFRESRDSQGKLAYLSWEQEQEILQQLPLVDVETDHLPDSDYSHQILKTDASEKTVF
ncbi:hypothetical protein [Sodalinema gerasimenkoae]|uniref:hypothetical protein n=1 Tax=Sodalinema gerasimenkoae TaxID=2862348 RepID=UPI0018657A1A|nr:hypothetical protein [Sodalinema gerasimenkoae]